MKVLRSLIQSLRNSDALTLWPPSMVPKKSAQQLVRSVGVVHGCPCSFKIDGSGETRRSFGFVGPITGLRVLRIVEAAQSGGRAVMISLTCTRLAAVNSHRSWRETT